MDNPGKEQTNAGTEHTGRGAGKGAQSVCVLFQEKCRTDEKILESRKRDRAVRILIDALIQYLRGVIERYKSPEIKIDYDDMEVMLRFFACGMMGILIHYADNPQLSEEKLIEQIRRILTGRLVPGKQDPPQ